jgi:hypothetical protein
MPNGGPMLRQKISIEKGRGPNQHAEPFALRLWNFRHSAK